MDLNGKVALITGGARMGATIGEALAQKGCHVCFTYRTSQKSIAQAQERVERQGVNSLAVHGNVGKPADVKKIVQVVIKKFGRLDILINMASVYVETKWQNLSEKEWDMSMDADLKGAYLMGLAAAPSLKKTRGRIINLSDWLSQSGRPRYKNFLTYFTCKTGVMGLTQALALELAPEVLVNAISPGPILAPAGTSKSELNQVKKATPLQRWGGPEEIAKAVLFFCESDFVTGECIRVDGGRHLY